MQMNHRLQKELLQFFVCKVNAQLLEGVDSEKLKPVYVEKSDVLISIRRLSSSECHADSSQYQAISSNQ